MRLEDNWIMSVTVADVIWFCCAEPLQTRVMLATSRAEFADNDIDFRVSF